jgi:alkylation response protein AidB-like acyl-CoA dehydrogenase
VAAGIDSDTLLAFAVPDGIRPLRDRVAEFVEKEIQPHEAALSYGGPPARTLAKELEQKAKAAGLWALGAPREWGGGGLAHLDYSYINEVVGRSGPAVQILGTIPLHTCQMIDLVATEEQKRNFLGPATTGEIRLAFAVTEPDVASSDPTQIQTRAELDGGEWVINGKKWFISAADRADWIIVMARTEGDDVKRHERFSMIFVPVPSAGLVVGEELRVLGLNSIISGHYEVFLDDVRVPAGNLLGTRGQGFLLAQERLAWGRIYHCMRWLGAAQRAFNLLCIRANSRQTGGAPLADRQLVQQMVFDSYTEMQGARLMVLDAAAKLQSGKQARVEVSAIKVVCARMLGRVVDRAIQVYGAEGLSQRLPLEIMYREARYGRIVDGPDEVHIQRVGRSILREYREGRDWDFGYR